ncbi:Shugoshin-like 1 [Oryzias melastigma]|uniref:Shugoshin-like 1 n=1 Tax=Oryzias melastigma TaxID=30732 RepID=A0A834FP72_ORYME|nr:Shugoshin-like 1 [Oryzias melastigma]
MAKERAQKKSYQDSLEDIKERMKEKRNKRLASASSNRGRPRNISKNSGPNSTHTILMGVQLNNKALAVALEAEKEKVRQANAVILQLKREQQALFLHLILLKRKLKEQEAFAAAECKAPDVPAEPHRHMDSPKNKRTALLRDEHTLEESSPVCAGSTPGKKPRHSSVAKEVVLPSTVGVRRQRADRRSRRRSECVQQTFLTETDLEVGFESALSPIPSEVKSSDQKQQRAGKETVDPCRSEAVQHSTPEPPPAKRRQQPNRRQAQPPPPRSKPESAPQKQERGRKPERRPLKKPWENPKPRARSKSRDRSAVRAKAGHAPQSSKLNSSLGFDDTFDFDCKEEDHVTPFKAKPDDSQPSSPTGEAPQAEASATNSDQNTSSSPSQSSESDDSLYVPQRTQRAQTTPPDQKRAITTRRGRPSKAFGQKENIPPKQEFSVFRDEDSNPKAPEAESCEESPSPLPQSDFSESPKDLKKQKEKPQREQMADSLLSVSPLVEAELTRIDHILNNYGDGSCEAPAPQTLKGLKPCGAGVRTAGRGLSLCDVTNLSPAAYRKFSCSSKRSSEARCSTPVPARKRRCTLTVDYKEPSLNAKLRRGDKHTDLQFLRSPIFKQKSGRKSVRMSRKSSSSQQVFEKYNESFVGCR